ncbi:MAG: DNA mismatch repair endonuclease MutL [Anaerolineae bacterium]|nr:DNA mismatch repair endonuclease MutL [Anaerolineae bacterium]
MPIVVLAEDVAAKIAAGEVIERPVSVVKELVENALDAEATDIRVEIREGGQRLIRVADNGVGIPAVEVETAFQRHATSKVREAEDLFHIRTLGFRGEALPSIAAVSRVTLVTRTRDETVGSRLRLEGGRLVERASVGAPAGTVLTVENLFFNTPARLKFLKSATAEAGQVHTLLQHLALAYPDVRLSLVSDGRTIFQHTGGDLRDSLTTIYGVEVGRQMIGVEGEAGGEDDLDTLEVAVTPRLTVQGFVSPPAVSRANRAHMTFIVNGRWVQDRSLNVAVTEAYHTLLMVGRFPISVLHITLAPEEVDVNVHPAKAEIRFRDGRAVFSLVQQAVRSALLRHAPVPQFGGSPVWDDAETVDRGQWFMPGAAATPPLAWTQNDQTDEQTGWTGRMAFDTTASPAAAPAAGQAVEPSLPLTTAGGGKLPMLRVLGQVGQAYIIAEGPDGLYLIDQHAAHERVLYEEFLQAHARSEVGRQALLSPLPLDLTPGEAALLGEQAERLDHLGFSLEPFGPQTVLVRAVPTILRQADPRQAIRDILAQMGEGRRNPLEADIEAALLRAVCKTAATKAGQTLSMTEMQALIRQLEASSSPRTCPHGRPTMIHLSAGFLAREFGRLG